jgi:glycosyltransferase involved in cell wall biosynthesis
MLSVVIPVYNEAESLETLHRELSEVALAQGYDLDIIFVDDGSTDRSWSIIRGLAEGDERVRGLRFRRNFGKAAALSAGFSHARGDLVMTLDADLQDDPSEIPRFLAAMQNDLDVVSGWKKVRRDPWHKVFTSRVFNALASKLTGVELHDHNCGMKCCRREIFDEVRLYGELHRFVPVLAASRGFRVGEIEINHRPRQFGRSKYGPERFVKGFLDLLTVKFLAVFGQRPQHIFGSIGLVAFAIGTLMLVYLGVYWIISRLGLGLEAIHLSNQPLLLCSMTLLLLGGQLMSIGFLAELFISYHSPDTKTYSICERAGVKDERQGKQDDG